MRTVIILWICLNVHHAYGLFKLNHYGNLDNILVNMARSLEHRLTHVSTKHSCELIVSDLYKYHNYLADIYLLLKDKSLKNQREGKRLYKIVGELGGPITNRLKIDYEHLERVYNWKDDDTKDAIEEIVKETEYVWRTIVKKVEKMRKYV